MSYINKKRTKTVLVPENELNVLLTVTENPITSIQGGPVHWLLRSLDLTI